MPDSISQTLTRHQFFIQRYGGGEFKKLIPVLRQMLKDIKAMMQNAPPNQVARLLQIETEIRLIVDNAAGKISQELLQSANDLIKYESGFTTRFLDSLVTVKTSGVELYQLQAVVTATPMKLLKGANFNNQTIEQAINHFAGAVKNDILQKVRMGIVSGQTTPEITKQITSQVQNRTVRQAEALARTTINHVASETRNQVIKENAELFDGERFVATLDGRTTVTCFPGETVISSIGNINSVFKRLYSGEFIIIRTATGNEICGTPNHPVLTTDGWLPLDKIKPSEHVVYSIGNEGACILSDDRIAVPTAISKVFDSFANFPLSNIDVKRSSTDQFHGDGMTIDGKVNIVNSERFLRSNQKIRFGHYFKKSLLGFIHNFVAFFCGSFFNKYFLGRFPIFKSDKIQSSPVDCGVKPRLGTRFGHFWKNITGLYSRPVKVDGQGSVGFDSGVANPPWEGWHYSKLLKEIRNRGGGRVEIPSDAAGGLPVTVTEDNVISVRREYKTCHVYNLHCCQGLYIAGGIVVKNCAGFDGQKFDVNEGPMPPLHWNCRSTRVPLVKESLRVPGFSMERASMTGPVDAKVTYGGFLKRQSKEFQNEVLGPKRAALFRSGKVSISNFTDDNGRVLTLKQLAEKENLVL
jgi:hypothetical protein